MQLTYRGVIYTTHETETAANGGLPQALTYRGCAYTSHASVSQIASPTSSLKYRGNVYQNH